MTPSEPIKQIEDVEDISAITYGFLASKALFAALDFDLFTRIEEGSTRRRRWRGRLIFPGTDLLRCLRL